MDPLGELVGDSPAFVAVKSWARRLLAGIKDAQRLPLVLIQGETGTGKGLLARTLHAASVRASGAFVPVNCAAIPETLVESELFGFEAGAHSEARRAKPGLFQAAHGGTIFLDEVGLLPQAQQAKLLSVIEDRRVRRVGGLRDEPVDVWIISATNSDLSADVHDRKFRSDLYQRLAVMRLTLPPLRERGPDVLRLAEGFLARACADYGLRPKRLAPDARRRLMEHAWPGNVRELSNVIERAALLVEGDLITASALELEPQPGPRVDSSPVGFAVETGAATALDRSVREHHRAALEQTGWNITRTAALLGISRNTLRARIEKFGLRAPQGTVPDLAGGIAAESEAASAERQPVAAEPTGQARREQDEALLVASVRPAVRWERRWVAMLRVDLSAPEPESEVLDTGAVLDVLVEKVQAFGGQVLEIGRTRLDAAFGLDPIESAPERAANAALAILRAAARARERVLGTPVVRIAVHAGSYPVTRLGTWGQIDVDAKGEASAVLDRLVPLTEPDSAFVSRVVAPFLQRRFTLSPTGAAVAGEASRLLGREALPLAFGERMSPFVGRRAEMAVLESRWALTRQGMGQVVGIVGQPGVGKSRLTWEFIQANSGEERLVLEAASSALGRPTPYGAVIDLLRVYFGIDPGEAERAIRDKVERRLGELDPSLGFALPAILSLLDVRVVDAAWQVLDPDRRHQQMLDAIRRLMLRESVRQPLLLVFEDAHWADSETKALLDAVADGLPTSRVLMLVTHRPEYQHGWSGRTFYTQLRVDPLRGEHAEELLHELLGEDASLVALKRQLIEWTDGNPFFLEETVRTLVETGVLDGARGEYRLTRPVTGIAVPGTVEAVLAGRMARLGAMAHEVLRSAAVVGRQVPHDVLVAVSKLPDTELRETVERLVAGEFLYEAPTSVEREYAFRHALTHEVAYASVPAEQRPALHASAMEALARVYQGREADRLGELAHHAFEGRVWDQAVTYLRQAGRRAAARSANREAVECFTQALTALSHLPPDRVRREEGVDLRFDLRSALWPLGEIDRMGAVLNEAADLAEGLQDVRRQGFVATARCHYFFLKSRHAEAVAVGDQAVALARSMGNRALECDAMLYTGIVHGAMGNYGRAIELLQATLDAFERAGAALLPRERIVGQPTARSYIARYLAEIGELRRAADHAGAGMKGADGDPAPWFLATSYFGLGSVELRRGDAAAAIAFLERALELCETHGLQSWYPSIGASLGHAYAGAGRAAEAVALLEQAVARADRMRLSASYSMWLTYLGVARLRLGRIADAERAATAALDRARAQGERGHEAWALYLMASVAATRGATDVAGAEKAFADASDVARGLGMRPLLAMCHAGLAAVYERTGRTEAAHAARAMALGIREEIGMTPGGV